MNTETLHGSKKQIKDAESKNPKKREKQTNEQKNKNENTKRRQSNPLKLHSELMWRHDLAYTQISTSHSIPKQYNEIKSWHRRNTRVYRISGKGHKKDEQTQIFNDILKTKEIPDSWHEAKILILFKKGDSKDTKNYRPISLLSHSYKIFTRLLQAKVERTLDENQTREQAGFRKDHLQALNQIIEKWNEYNLPLCIGFNGYEKAFDTVEHFAIFEALRKNNINEAYINISQNIYSQASARIHLDKLVSNEVPINRGVRQGDPLSRKVFTSVMEEVFKKADIYEGIDVDGENLTNLGFADDIALFNKKTKQNKNKNKKQTNKQTNKNPKQM